MAATVTEMLMNYLDVKCFYRFLPKILFGGGGRRKEFQVLNFFFFFLLIFLFLISTSSQGINSKFHIPKIVIMKLMI